MTMFKQDKIVSGVWRMRGTWTGWQAIIFNKVLNAFVKLWVRVFFGEVIVEALCPEELSWW